MKKLFLGMLLSLLVFTSGCAGLNGGSKAIIKVNGQEITQKDFDDALNSQMQKTFIGAGKVDLKDQKNKFMTLVMTDKTVNELIIKEILEQEMAKRKIDVSNTEVNKAYDDIVKKLGGKDKVEEALKANGISQKEFMSNLKQEVKLKKLIDSVSVTKVSDGEIKKFYNDNKATKFTRPDLVKASHILISASEDEIKTKITSENPKISETELKKEIAKEMAAKKAKAEDVLKQVKAKPEDFAKLAKKYSEDFTSAQQGGDLGFFSRKDMVKPFSDVAFATKPGDVSDIVKTNFGYHIIYVTDRKTAGTASFDQVKEEISLYLENQKKIEALQKLIAGLKNSAKIEYIDSKYDPKNVQKELKDLSKNLNIGAPQAEQKEKVKK